MNQVLSTQHKSKQATRSYYIRRKRQACLPAARINETESHVIVRLPITGSLVHTARVFVQGTRLFIGLSPVATCQCGLLYCRCEEGVAAKSVLTAVRLPRAVDASAMVVQYVGGMLRVFLPKEDIATAQA